MTAGKTPPIHVLRGLLRQIRTAPKQEMPKSTSAATTLEIESSNRDPNTNTIATTSDTPLISHVLSQYRTHQTAPPAQASILRKMAYDLYTLKKNLRDRGELHQLDGGAEVKLSPKELSRLAAHRAGLELPEEAAH